MKQFLIFLIAMMIVPSAVHADWQELTTSRFRIIFHETDSYTAERVASMADRVYADATQFMDYEPRERIPVVIYGYTAEANGFFTSYPPHIGLFVASPTSPWLGAGADWIETLFVHELVHYMHLTQPIGFFGSVRPLIGPVAPSPSLIFMPGWALEGPTVYAETALAPGGRGENPFFEMQHAAPVLEGRMYSYDQAGMSSPFAPSGRFYASGYLIVDHLLREYGDDAFNELNRHFQRWPFLGMRRAVRRTTGLRAGEMWDNVVAELEERWAYRLEIPLGDAVTPAGPGNWQLPVQTDRGLVTYASGAYQVPGLYVASSVSGAGVAAGRSSVPGTSTVPGTDAVSGADTVSGPTTPSPESWQLLAPVQPTDEFSWTVDSTGTIAVVAVVSRERAGTSLFSNRILPSTSNLWVLDLNDAPRGARPAPARQLTFDRQLLHPQLSPDGQRLVAIEREASYSRLVNVDIQSGEVSRLLSVERGRVMNPSFSPDGALLAVTLDQGGRSSLLIVDATSPHRVRAHGPELPRGAEVHLPRIVTGENGLEVWYGAAFIDRGDSQLLGLYRSRLNLDAETSEAPVGIGRPELVVEDRIGAYAGFPVAGNTGRVLYASYSSDGFVIRTGEKTARGSAGETTAETRGDLRQAEIASGAEETPGLWTAGEQRRYYDLPRPILWAPTGGTAFDDDTDGTIRFLNSTAGILVMAVSNRVRHELEIEALWHIQGNQPVGSVQYIYTPGQTSFTLNAGYELSILPIEDDEFRQSTSRASASASRPLWSQFAPGVTRTLSGSARASYERVLDVILSDDTPVIAPTISETAQFSTGLTFGSSQAGSARDWSTGTPGSSVSTQAIVVPPILSNTETLYVSLSSATARMNPWRARRGLAGGIQLSHTLAIAVGNSNRAGSFLPYRALSASDTQSASVATNAAALGRLETRIPLPIADAAWRGLGFTSSAVSLFVEQAVVVVGSGFEGIASGSVSPVPETVLGAEVTARGRFNLVDWPVSAGISARIPHSGEAGRPVFEAYFRL